MAVTIARSLAARIRYQTTNGEQVIEKAGDQSGAVFGNPNDVLSVRGNVSDIALTNHLWLLDAIAAGAVDSTLPPALQQLRPTSIDGAVAFLGPRDTDSAEQAITRLRQVNGVIADKVQDLPDAALDKIVNVTFYGEKTLRELLFIIIEHGWLHLGQSWGILKGKGIA